MRVFGGKGLVSMVVQNYVEEVVHKHMVGLVGNYKVVHHIYHLGMHLGMALDHSNLVEVGCHEKVHHNYCLGMHHRMVVGYSALEGVVAKRVDVRIFASKEFYKNSGVVDIVSKPTEIPSYKRFGCHK